MYPTAAVLLTNILAIVCHDTEVVQLHARDLQTFVHRMHPGSIGVQKVKVIPKPIGTLNAFIEFSLYTLSPYLC